MAGSSETRIWNLTWRDFLPASVLHLQFFKRKKTEEHFWLICLNFNYSFWCIFYKAGTSPRYVSKINHNIINWTGLLLSPNRSRHKSWGRPISVLKFRKLCAVHLSDLKKPEFFICSKVESTVLWTNQNPLSILCPYMVRSDAHWSRVWTSPSLQFQGMYLKS